MTSTSYNLVHISCVYHMYMWKLDWKEPCYGYEEEVSNELWSTKNMTETLRIPSIETGNFPHTDTEGTIVIGNMVYGQVISPPTNRHQLVDSSPT